MNTINGIIRMNPDYTIFLVEVIRMTQDLIFYIITTAIAIAIGIVSYFLKRTISELDNCKRDIMKVKEDYITKEDFFREQSENRRKLDRIMDILLEVKGEIGNGNG